MGSGGQAGLKVTPPGLGCSDAGTHKRSIQVLRVKILRRIKRLLPPKT